jgi:hypothetical protein
MNVEPNFVIPSPDLPNPEGILEHFETHAWPEIQAFFMFAASIIIVMMFARRFTGR